MKVGKPKSKRVPVRLRHKIQKASAAKQRKQKKQAKKDPTWRSKLKKDPGIPNLFPYKDRILKEIEQSKNQKQEDAARLREMARAQRDGGHASVDAIIDEDPDALLDLEDEDEDEDLDGDETMVDKDSANPMAALLASARARASKFDHTNGAGDDDDDDEDAMDDEDDDDNSNASSFAGLSPPPPNTTSFTSNGLTKDTSRKAHSAAINNLISTSDVLLYVLDARDPISTRSPAVEKAILADPTKRLILILNKIDLVPAAVLKSWVVRLKRSFPTLPLRAGASAPKAKTFDHKHLTLQFTANNVIKALKSYAANQQLSRALTVGVLGYPNVGKSSVINALTSRLSGSAAHKRGRGGNECPVGAEAGVTTALREVKLDGSIKLVDSPGVVFPSLAGGQKAKGAIEEHARLVLLNAIPPREIEDPTPAVTLLLRRFSSDPSSELLPKLLDVYGIPALVSDDGKSQKDITTAFLVEVARKRGRLGKGGVPNLHAAAQTVVSDWRDGRIQSWVDVPSELDVEINEEASGPLKGAEKNAGNRAKDQKTIVSEWGAEFKIEGLWGDGDASGKGLGDEADGQDIAMS